MEEQIQDLNHQPASGQDEMTHAINNEHRTNEHEEANAEEPKFAGRFNSVQELEDGYRHAHKKISERLGNFHGKPDEGYEYNSEFENSSIDLNDPMFDDLLEFAAGNNLSQDGFEHLLGTIEGMDAKRNAEQSRTASFEADDHYNSEIELLGGEAEACGIFEGLANNLAHSGLSDEAIDRMLGSVDSVEDLAAIDHLCGNSSYSEMPGSTSNGHISKDFLMEQMKANELMHGLEKVADDARIADLFAAKYN